MCKMDILWYIAYLWHPNMLETYIWCQYVVFMFAKIFHVGLTAKTIVEIEKIGFQMNLHCFSVNARISRLVLLPVDWFCVFLFFFKFELQASRPVCLPVDWPGACLVFLWDCSFEFSWSIKSFCVRLWGLLIGPQRDGFRPGAPSIDVRFAPGPVSLFLGE